jgi:hypothetical protein
MLAEKMSEVPERKRLLAGTETVHTGEMGFHTAEKLSTRRRKGFARTGKRFARTEHDSPGAKTICAAQERFGRGGL